MSFLLQYFTMVYYLLYITCLSSTKIHFIITGCATCWRKREYSFSLVGVRPTSWEKYIISFQVWYFTTVYYLLVFNELILYYRWVCELLDETIISFFTSRCATHSLGKVLFFCSHIPCGVLHFSFYLLSNILLPVGVRPTLGMLLLIAREVGV